MTEKPIFPLIEPIGTAVINAQNECAYCTDNGIRFVAHGRFWLYFMPLRSVGYAFDTQTRAYIERSIAREQQVRWIQLMIQHVIDHDWRYRKPETHLFTFGQAHVHSVNGVTCDKDSVVEITGTFEQARRLMVAMFGQKWSMQYTPENISMNYYPRGIVLRLDASAL